MADLQKDLRYTAHFLLHNSLSLPLYLSFSLSLSLPLSLSSKFLFRSVPFASDRCRLVLSAIEINDAAATVAWVHFGHCGRGAVCILASTTLGASASFAVQPTLPHMIHKTWII